MNNYKVFLNEDGKSKVYSEDDLYNLANDLNEAFDDEIKSFKDIDDVISYVGLSGFKVEKI